jgi:hypothetical protein
LALCFRQVGEQISHWRRLPGSSRLAAWQNPAAKFQAAKAIVHTNTFSAKISRITAAPTIY